MIGIHLLMGAAGRAKKTKSTYGDSTVRHGLGLSVLFDPTLDFDYLESLHTNVGQSAPGELEELLIGKSVQLDTGYRLCESIETDYSALRCWDLHNGQLIGKSVQNIDDDWNIVDVSKGVCTETLHLDQVII